ncbi:hypothetical protein BSW62_20715 [Salmonella enterica subsp. enterica serovar Enteritidis]|nr:hypothetical protein [Salmonella enterica subsp. enterica serovar Enteritidis]EDN7025681.1 hypothetical protein [Salmonella enterica]
MEIFIALTVATVPVAWMVWDRYFRILPLSYFGIENVQMVAKWESTDWREQVFTRGGMTRKEWLRVNTRQLEAISAELHRRNPDERRD